MSDIYNSNTIPHGSYVLEITNGTTPVNYVAENISTTRPTTGPNRTNEVGEPNGWARVFGQVTGSATLQIATSSTARPQLGWYFIENFGYDYEKFVITGIGQPFAQGDYYKVTVDLMKDHTYVD